MNKFRLEKKVALVCGGLGLLGREISIALAQAGAKVIILDISDDLGLSFQEECQKSKLSIIYKKFDIANLSNYKEILTGLNQEQGPIDIFVNVAYPRTADWLNEIEDIKIDSWQRNIDLQLNSACLLAKEVAQLMKNNNVKGSIINFGSIYGVVAPTFDIYKDNHLTFPAAYSAIKGGIINFSKYLASYYGGFGIRVNCLCPGGIINNQEEKFISSYEKRTLLNRMGKPEEIASATVFLASNAASYITGTTFMVDGGWTSI
ncbi:SDR family oxidoreductase [Candidatus Woesearchaeota archaeon]|nr:SDR family oxidoreductase [Candidatus Woesearchaeota archaeon]